MRFIKPNFKRNIVNISATLAEFLGCPNEKPTLPILEKELSKDYKNVVFLILDGLGINPIKINLDKHSILRRNIKQVLTSTFPSTTTNATTSYLTNKYPMEHGWFAWCMYFEELDRVVDVYLAKDTYTRESIDKGFVKKTLPIVPYYKKANTDRDISVVVPEFWHNDDENRYAWKTIDEMFANIENLCQRENKQFIYAYCDDPDHTMHENGVSSKEAHTVINKLNEGVDKLSKKLKDTLFVVSADHGQIDIDGYIEIYKDNKILSMLEKPLVFEPRATGMFVKKGNEKEFEKLFNQKYGKDFKLLKISNLLKQNYFGGNFVGPNARFLPNFIAVGKTNKLLVYSPDMPKFKGHHTSLTKEMEVPLILIGEKKTSNKTYLKIKYER